MLKLTHDSICEAIANTSEMVLIQQIRANSNMIKNKIIKRSGKTSKFLGCFTDVFAKRWGSTFEVIAEGAKLKIDFGVIDRPSKNADIISRLQKSNPDTGWQIHSPPPTTAP